MIKGVIAGNFEECKENCDHFTILLHSDPTIERPNKLKPILSVDERIEVLSSIKFIDDIKVYTYEKELLKLLEDNKFKIRFLGDDYIGKSFTGDELNIDIHYLSRDHGWTTTKFKKLIAETLKTKK
jgi:glycerol-3-phosphate cytidylyltransferase